MRTIPSAAVSFVAAHEGLRLRAYQDDGGVWTLGFGHVDGVKAGDRCTRQEALIWLADDLRAARAKLSTVLRDDVIASLTDAQWTALLSFVFNLGAEKNWTLWKRLNAGQFDQAPAEMIRFVNVGDRKVQGLVNRRADEIKLWSVDEPGSDTASITSAETRAAPTPPTPREPSLTRGNATLLVSAAGAVASAAPMVDQARNAIEPFAGHSGAVQRMLGLLAVLGALLALMGLALIWLKHQEARL